MPTSRPFAYNTGSTISGTEQIGDIAIGISILNYSGGVGGVKWWNGPDEDLGYVIAQSIPEGDQPAPGGQTASIGFFRSTEKTEESFVELANRIQNGLTETFTTGNEARIWLNENGYWTSFTNPLWTPSLITTGMWYDADDANTFTLVGNAVSEWRDKSTNNRNLSQSNVSSRPNRVANSLNGKPVVDFLSTNTRLDSGTIPAISNGTYYTVFKAISPAVTGQAPWSFNGGSTRNAGIVHQQNSGLDPFLATKPVVYDGEYGIVSYTQNAPTNTHIALFNGSTFNGTFQYSISGNTYSGPLSLGLRQVGSIFMNCQIAELIICYEVHNTTTRQLVEGYLAWKWGLQNNLISGHPYKNNAPTI